MCLEKTTAWYGPQYLNKLLAVTTCLPWMRPNPTSVAVIVSYDGAQKSQRGLDSSAAGGEPTNCWGFEARRPLNRQSSCVTRFRTLVISWVLSIGAPYLANERSA